MFARACVVHGTTVTLPVVMLYGCLSSFGIHHHSSTEGLSGKGSSKKCRFIEILVKCVAT